MSERTNLQYDFEAKIIRQIFIDKNKDYGNSWKILRISSLIDQIFIKADRIRNIEEGIVQKIDDSIRSEYQGIINYSILTIIQLENSKTLNDNPEKLFDFYDQKLQNAKELMIRKNHDYGEAWRKMYITSFTDMILSKILRMRQILDNKGKTIASEGLESNLYDMINYSFFALIKLREKDETK